jgi:hypothetical protein
MACATKWQWQWLAGDEPKRGGNIARWHAAAFFVHFVTAEAVSL